MLYNASLYRVESGRVVGIFAAARDVSEQMRAQAALVESEEKLRLAMEASESGTWDLDVRSGTIVSSPSCQAMLGYEAVEVADSLDAAWAAKIHPEDREGSLAALRDISEGRSTVYERDHRLLARDGSWVWVHGKGRVVEWASDGQPVRLLVTRTNITARKEAEAAALENARLFEQQRRIATVLQENFIHQLPSLDGLELGATVQAAFEPELVGGDFSDVFVLDNSLVAALIGDVAGKGIRAAGLAETVRSTVRAFAMIDSSPAFILRKTNQLLLNREGGSEIVTAFLLILDRAEGKAICASAGHPAPVHLTADACGLLEVPAGLPLGSFNEDYLDAHVTINRGDYVIFYSDGVTEARRRGELFGDERLIESVAALWGSSPQEIVQQVRHAASEFADTLKDDLEVLALRLR